MTMTTLHQPARKKAFGALSPATTGALLGLATAMIWGANQVAARYGVSHGLDAFDIAALRFGTAGLVLLPWLLSRGVAHAAGVGWIRALTIALLIGPIFFALNVGGYVHAPLAHGAIILPATFCVASIFAAVVFLPAQPLAMRCLRLPGCCGRARRFS
jgi:drug/metabolite transporter (DMT)-like permease